MKDFWGFYQNFETIPHPFQLFGGTYFIYLLVIAAAIVLCFRKYKQCSESGRLKWQHGFALYLFIQEMFFYIWTYVSCKSDPLFEVLQLELCTFCLFVDFSTLFHKNKQARFFGAVIGLIGGPIALIYPATVADIYPAFCYRVLNCYMTHGAYILFSLMLLEDQELLNRKRLLKNIGILACVLTGVYFFDMKFGTQYMFVGTPPNIGIIRMLYELVGPVFFLPVAILIFSSVQALVYMAIRRLQEAIYGEDEEPEPCFEKICFK